MKILHIVPTYLPAYRYGGPILSVHALNKWLVRARVDVTVYTTNMDGKKRLNVPLGEETNIDGVKVFYFPVSFVPWQYSVAMHRALAAHTGEFDVVHITSVFLAASTLGARYAKKFKKPYIISPRGSLMKEPLAMKGRWKKALYLSLVEKRNLAGAAMIHFTSEAERKEYVAQKFPPSNSFVVVPNAFDPEAWFAAAAIKFRSHWEIPLSRQIVLAMGRIGWKKGFDTLIPAFARVARKNAEALLVISGADDDGYRARVEKMVKEHQLEKNILFTGPFENVDVPALTEASVFVLPSYSENFGMAVVQAMYAGVPVVVTPQVALSSEIIRTGAGLVVEKDVEALAAAILRILDDREAAHRMGAQGKEFVQSLVAPTVARRFKAVYASILRSKI